MRQLSNRYACFIYTWLGQRRINRGDFIFDASLGSTCLAERISTTEAKAQESRRMAEAYLRLNETIIERMQTGVVAIDRHQRIKTANLAAQQMLNSGLSSKTLVG